jgi:hypothetical protein
MTLPVPDRRVTLGAIGDALARYTHLLRSVSNPRANAIGSWSIAETATHTSHIASELITMLEGGRSPVEDHLQMSAAWQHQLELDPQRDPKAIAQRLDDSVARFVELASEDRWTEDVTWHGDIKAPVYMLATTLVSEAEIHGLDIARAEGRPWSIPQEHALMSIQGLLPVLPHFLRTEVVEDFRATFRVDLRGAKPLYFQVHDGTMAVSQEQPGQVDCRVNADPLAYLLVGYGRQSQWGPLLTGKIVAWGRKPWLGLRFGKLFVNP